MVDVRRILIALLPILRASAALPPAMRPEVIAFTYATGPLSVRNARRRAPTVI